ncbi:MAG: electron transport complex protein RnfA [Desulfovibrionaceae bacterium]
MDIFEIFITAIFVSNIVLTQYLGLCPFIGTSKEKGVSLSMSAAVVVVILLVTMGTWLLQAYLLIPYKLEYLQTIFFIVLIASLVQLLEMFLRKVIPPIYKSLGIYLPLITTNCAVLGVAIAVQRAKFGFTTAIYFSLATAIGFGLALFLMSGQRERLQLARLPKVMQGVPIAFLLAGIMSLSFIVFKSIV